MPFPEGDGNMNNRLKMFLKFSFSAIFALVFLLAACAGPQLEVKPIAKTENPQELINKLENEIALARENQVNVLAPDWFSDADSSLNDAKEALDEGGELAVIFESVANGQAQLRRAEEISKISRRTLPEAIKARDLARTAGAANLGEDYADAEEQFLKLTRAIEKNNLNYAQRNQARVTEIYRQLELRAIKIQTLGEVRNLLRVAKKQDADEIAPQSYALAKKKLAEADAFITEHPYEKEKMHAMANDALFMARRLLEVIKQSESIETMKPEQITLRIEGLLFQVAKKLKAPDMRDHSFDKQVENIVASVEAQQADYAFMVKKSQDQQKEIQALEDKIAEMEGLSRKEQEVKERLLAEKRFNQQLSSVQGFFEPNEAEVYKKENQVIIRLKAMYFPVGQSVIMPQNYVLLSKVQRAISLFGEPDVIIGGHTDSTGSEGLNEMLSQQRAEAVRQYFVANGTIPFEKIIAVGYGSMRPIASNATEAGRAMNRRIDITLAPQMQTSQ
jgi:outer membrane protein OmpA-like peptidoglycan-associated protein